MLLRKDGSQAESYFEVLEKDFDTETLSSGSYLFPISEIDQAIQFQSGNSGKAGIWFDSSDKVEISPELLNQFALVAVNFPTFIDGRGYSIAFLLRDRQGFEGDIRAIGDVLIDQLSYMRRCGFSSFQLREDQDFEAAIQEMNCFSHVYQASADDEIPAYRLRHQ